MKIGERLRSVREYMGFSIEQAANYCGITGSFLIATENGSEPPSDLRLKRLSELYCHPVEFFLLGKAEPASDALHELTAGLDDGDRDEVLAFAEFLKFRKQTKGKK